MSNPFFERPILNSPYEHPIRHWKLDESKRGRAKFVTTIPKSKMRKAALEPGDLSLADEARHSLTDPGYETTAFVHEVREMPSS
jgi:type III restriction enzyme